MPVPFTLSFEGAARTVTGSRHRIRFGAHTWLFDCGLYQGHRDDAERINRSFRFAPAEIDTVVVSHAHLDHTGNLPTLVRQGFGGAIHATAPTAELSAFMLADSAFLMQRDIDHVNRHATDGRPRREALYGPEDVERTVERFERHALHEPWTLFDGVRVTYHDAGHIIGAATTIFECSSNGRTVRLAMGGDLGRPNRPILRDPETPPGVDVLVMESTYGDRLHPDEAETERGLAAVVSRTVARGGRVIVPAFAVGRTQELVATLHALTERGEIPEVPIFVDSPMASRSTAVYRHHPEWFDDETRRAFDRDDGAPFGFARLRYVGTADESRALNERREPCIIVSASGMCEGGRVVHHLVRALPDERNAVVLVGFQAEGTLGRRLHDGADVVHMLGERVVCRAEVVALEGFSAHADQHELVEWAARLRPAPRRIYLVHGEAAPAEVLAGCLRERIGAEVHVPEPGQVVDLWN